MKYLTRREQITKMHIKFYKQFRTLALKQFKQMQAFYEAEDTVALQKRMRPIKHGHNTTTSP